MAKIQLNLDQLKAEQAELTAFLARPDAFSDPAYPKKTKRLSELAEIITLVERQTAVTKQLRDRKSVV